MAGMTALLTTGQLTTQTFAIHDPVQLIVRGNGVNGSLALLIAEEVVPKHELSLLPSILISGDKLVLQTKHDHVKTSQTIAL